MKLAAGGAPTSTTRSNPAGDARSQTPAGLGGLGLPGLEGMFGAMQDTTLVNQMMQNPAMSQMMQSLLSNPQYMNQVFNYYIVQDLKRSAPKTLLFASACYTIHLLSISCT